MRPTSSSSVEDRPTESGIKEAWVETVAAVSSRSGVVEGSSGKGGQGGDRGRGGGGRRRRRRWWRRKRCCGATGKFICPGEGSSSRKIQCDLLNQTLRNHTCCWPGPFNEVLHVFSSASLTFYEKYTFSGNIRSKSFSLPSPPLAIGSSNSHENKPSPPPALDKKGSSVPRERRLGSSAGRRRGPERGSLPRGQR